MRIILRLLFIIPLVWLAGFIWFMLSLPGPPDAPHETDAIVVLTGGPGRLAHGVELLREGRADRLLVSGVDPSVRPAELAAELGVDERIFTCCIDLGKHAENTIDNGTEIAAWAGARGYQSVRVVTAADHMPRALQEIEQAAGGELILVPDPVDSVGGLPSLATEYSKYAVRSAQRLAGRV